MKHKKLKKDWVFPTIPDGYDSAAVVIDTSGNVRLDFTNEAAREKYGRTFAFSFEESISVPKCAWPWVSGFIPSEDDWRGLGFLVGRMRDICFGEPEEKHMFLDWLDKG